MNSMRGFVLSILFAALGLSMLTKPLEIRASGQCVPPLEAISTGSYGPTFFGRVVSVLPVPGSKESAAIGRTVNENRFEVLHSVRGISGKFVTVLNAPSNTRSGDILDSPFKVGEYYLVFAVGDQSSGKLFTQLNECTLTGTIQTVSGWGILAMLRDSNPNDQRIMEMACYKPGAACEHPALPITGMQSNSLHPLWLALAAFAFVGMGAALRWRSSWDHTGRKAKEWM